MPYVAAAPLAVALIVSAAPVEPIDLGLREYQAQQASDWRAMLEAAKALEALYPGSPNPPLDRAYALAKLGDRAGAAEAYRRVLALDPDNATARSNLSAASKRRGAAPELMVQSGQAHGVAALSISADGRLLATAGGTVDVWDLATKKQIWAFGGGTSYSAAAVAISPDGAYVAAPYMRGDLHSVILVWSIADGAKVAELPLGKGSAEAIAYSSDGRLVAAGGAFGGVSVFEVASRRKLSTFDSGGTTGMLVFDPTGRYVLAGGSKGVRVHDTAQPQAKPQLIPAGRGWAYAVAFAPGGKELLIGGDDGKILVLDWATRAVKRSFERQYAGHRHLAVSTDGKYAAATATYSNTMVWDLASGKELGTPAGADGPLGFVPGTSLLAVGRGREVAIFDTATLAETAVLAARSHAVRPVAFSPDGKLLATGGADGVIDLWDLPRARRLRTFQASKWDVEALAFNADGTALFSAQRSDQLYGKPGEPEPFATFFVPIDGGAIKPVEGPRREVSSMSTTPDRSRIALAERGGAVMIHDGKTGAKICEAAFRVDQTARAASGNAVTFLGEGKSFVVSVMGGVFAKEYETETCKPLREMQFYSDRVLGAGPGRVLSASLEYLSLKSLETALDTVKVTMPGHVTSMARSPAGRWFAVSAAAQVSIFDATTLEEKLRLSGHTGLVGGVAFSPDGRYLATTSLDGSTRLWELGWGTTLVSLVAMDAGEGIVATPEGWYTASKGALRGVAFRYQGRAYPFEQFDLKLNRPDLVLRRIGLAAEVTLDAFHRAYQRRLETSGFTEEMLDVDFALPVVKVDTSGVPLATKSRKLVVRAEASDAANALDRLLVFVNDVPLSGEELDLRAAASRTAKREVPIILGAGKNKIQVAVRNARGVESLKQSFEVTYDGPSDPPVLHVVAVGVSKYADGSQNLGYAAKDAGDLAKWFQSAKGRFEKVEVTRLLDKQATKEAVLGAREVLAKSKVDDVVMVFIAGHGLLDERLDYYFAPHDADFEHPSARGITHEQLEGLFDGIPARRRALLMDTCFSGELGGEPLQPPRTVGKARVRAVRPKAAPAAAPRLTGGADTFALVQELFANLRRGSGAVVIAAAGGAEFALEYQNLTNGVFTHAVLDGLKSRRADRDGDRTIRISELRDWVSTRVPELTGGQQQPTTRRENLELDFPVD